MNAQDAAAAPTAKIRPLSLIAMAAGGCCSALVFAPIAPVVPLIAASAGGGNSGAFAAQMSMVAPGMGLVAGGLLSGVFVDRKGIRSTLLVALTAFILFGTAGLLVEGVLPLAISRFALGFAAAMIYASADSFIGASFAPEKRGRILGIIGASAGTMALASNYFGGWIGALSGWRGPFWLYPILGMFFLFCAWVGTPKHSRTVSREEIPVPFLRNLMPIYLLVTSLYVGLMMANTQLGLLLNERGFSSPLTISVVIGMGPLLTIVASASYGWLLSWMRMSTLFTAGLLLLGAGLLLTGAFDSIFITSFGIALKGVASGLLNPFLVHVILNRAPDHARGRALGFMTSAMYLGNFINPIVVAPLKLMAGLNGAFLAIGLVMVFGAAVAGAVSRRSVSLVGR